MAKKVVFAGVILLLAMVTISLAKPKPQKKELTILSIKDQVMYFKVNRSFVGGWVEIYDENKNCLEADSLPHTHTMIYFDEMPPGNYTVKIKKGNNSVEFKYDSI